MNNKLFYSILFFILFSPYIIKMGLDNYDLLDNNSRVILKYLWLLNGFTIYNSAIYLVEKEDYEKHFFKANFILILCLFLIESYSWLSLLKT